MKNSIFQDIRNISTGVIGRYAGRLLVVLLLVFGLLTEVSYADNQERNQGQGISSSQAAAIASSQYGGEVLKVQRKGDQYQVKLLLPSGTIKTVYVSANR